MKNVFTKIMGLAVVALTLNSCYVKEDIPFVPPVVNNPTEYVVSIYTVDASNGNAALDVDLPMLGIDATKVTRLSTGVYKYTPTSPGNPSFIASKTGYYDAFATVNIPRGELNEVINCSVMVPLTARVVTPPLAAATYTLWGRVLKGADNSDLTPTTVTSKLRGKPVTGTVTITSNIFKVAFPEPGVYDITVNTTGYESVTLTQNIQQIPDGQEFVSELTVPMYMSGTVQGQYYSVRGTVMNVNRVVQLGASMTTQIDGVNATALLPNGTYEVLNLTSSQNISFVFTAPDCLPTAFQLSLGQFAGTPNITYDVYMRPAPTQSGSSSVAVVPNPTSGALPAALVVSTPGATPSANQTVEMTSSASFPTGTVFTDASNQIITAPFGISLSLVSQIAPVVASVGAQNLGTSLFALDVAPTGIGFSNPAAVTVSNPFGTLAVDQSFLAPTTEVQTKALPANARLLSLVGNQLTGTLLRSGSYIGVTYPNTPAVISATLTDDGVYAEAFYNRTGGSLSNVVYEYYAKTGNVYAPGNTPEALIDAANLSFANANERLYLIAYMKTIIREQLGETATTLTPVKVLRETGASCAANQYMKTTTTNKYSERTSTFQIKDSASKSVTIVVKVRNYITSSIFELDLYDANHHSTGSHLSNNGAGGGFGSSNL